MPSQLPPEIMQQNANGEAPNNKLGPQAKPKNLTNGRKQPGVKQKTPAQKVYPKLASTEPDGDQ